MEKYINFDANASTTINPITELEIIDKLKPYSFINLANTNSKISRILAGKQKKIINDMCKILNILPANLFFTSGASESNATVCYMISKMFDSGNIVTSTIEHKNMLMSIKNFLSAKFEIRFVKPNQDNYISIDDTRALIDSNTKFVTIMAANNETGIINDFIQIADLCRSKHIIFHSDVTQYIGKYKVGINKLDSFSASCHKFNGPKGVGFLYCNFWKPELSMIPGTQQRGFRGGTENFINSYAGCYSLLYGYNHRKAKNKTMMSRRKQIMDALKAINNRIIIINDTNRSLPNIIYASLNSIVNSETISNELDKYNIIIGHGSACNKVNSISYVLLELNGLNDTQKHNTIRISFDDFVTDSDISLLIERLETIIPRN